MYYKFLDIILLSGKFRIQFYEEATKHNLDESTCSFTMSREFKFVIFTCN